MKIALMVTGDIPSYMTKDEVTDLPRVLGKFFDHCDIYYHAWDNKKNRDYLEDFPRHVSMWDEMRVDYDPWDLIVKDKLLQEPWMRGSVPQKCRCQQHLSTAMAESCLTKQYDWHIRTRWDIIIRRDFVLNDWIDYAKQKDRVLGFGFQVRNIHTTRGPITDWLEYTHTKRLKTLDAFNTREPMILESVEDQLPTVNYSNYLMDFFMIYRPEDFDIDRVFTLSQNKKLYSVECGWHQILTEKRPHTNISGYFGMTRILNTDRERIRQDLLSKNVAL